MSTGDGYRYIMSRLARQDGGLRSEGANRVDNARVRGRRERLQRFAPSSTPARAGNGTGGRAEPPRTAGEFLAAPRRPLRLTKRGERVLEAAVIAAILGLIYVVATIPAGWWL